MKNSIMIVSLLMISTLFFQCGSSKNLSKTTEKPSVEEVVTEKPSLSTDESDVEIAIPLSEPEYRSTSEYYRVTQEGISPTSSMAKKVALQNARQELAASVQADLKLVIENYGVNRQIELNEEAQTKYQELAYTVVKQQLLGVSVIGEKLFKTKNNSYKYYVCIQMDKNALGEKVVEGISKDAKIKQDFDITLFKKVYNEQMDKFEKENSNPAIEN